jgi:hypothetical protein
MKIMIEVRGGMVACVSSTQDCSIYIVDHDNLKERGDDGESMREPYHPDFISNELSNRTPIFDAQVEDAIVNRF